MTEIIEKEVPKSERTIEIVDRKGAIAKIITPNNKVVTVIGNEEIRNSFEQGCLKQISTIADAPGIFATVLNPDAHWGYGCPIGSVFASRNMVYPNAVGPDVKCSMSFLQFNIKAEVLADKALRRKLINAIEQRIPNGPGNHMPPKARPFNDADLLKRVAIEGASEFVLKSLNIPVEWRNFCEDASHGDPVVLEKRLEYVLSKAPSLANKLKQLGGVGGGNHFLECNVVEVEDKLENVANAFGLVNGNIGFLCHFGSRGFGFMLTQGGGKSENGVREWPGQFEVLKQHFLKWNIPFPGGDEHNVYAPEGTPEFDAYMSDMNLGANFATVNHLLVCTYVLEAFREVLGDEVEAYLVYYIAHNIIRKEIVNKQPAYVHRKGATRAFYAGHHELKDTPFFDTGHPILLPGNPVDGSTIMVANVGAWQTMNSVNHGAGRTMGRKNAMRTFVQKEVDAQFDAADIVTNCRNYPVDECRAAYKPYDQVINSITDAHLAVVVARLRPVMNIKDDDSRAETSA